MMYKISFVLKYLYSGHACMGKLRHTILGGKNNKPQRIATVRIQCNYYTPLHVCSIPADGAFTRQIAYNKKKRLFQNIHWLIEVLWAFIK